MLLLMALPASAQEPTNQEKAALNAYVQLGLVMQMYLEQEKAQRDDAESRLKWVLDNWVHGKK